MNAKVEKNARQTIRIDAPAEHQRVGFLKGQIEVPEDFDRMGENEIAALFGVSA